ncbi:Phosphinothricin N-acetyltransferase [Marinobacterium lacunae]|uniref:Phosphinothricin N-acetyltransferase n=1 Tax=Marinobacterium lacunae TaxID=1232683 RepID=A0A081G4C8_9GAMM|nr:GNAT family N-acetyltransferase [Marinobacterium lacunae]KEA65633.1 Phosphinothricin N-acetyltransferase [Marinobacterium lacunae]
MQFVHCTYDAHAEQILAILNEAIVNSTALYDYEPRTLESMSTWFKVKESGSFPVMGAVENGKLIGFASYGTFRPWPAYKYTVEHSVYVHKQHRGRGLGIALMRALIAEARRQELHVMVGGIDISNEGSIALHEKLGFVQSGIVRQAAFKFGRWLDLGLYQLVLDTPRDPVDG